MIFNVLGQICEEKGVKIFIGLAPIGLAGLTLAKKDYQDHLSCVNHIYL